MPHTLRLATEDDAPQFAEILAPVIRDTVISFELTPPTADEMRGRIRKVLEFAPWIVFEDAGLVLGYAFAGPFRAKAAYRFTAETTIYIRDGHRGRRIGRTLYTALLDLLRQQGFRRAIGGISMPNDPSVGLHEAMGFRRVALFSKIGFKHGKWVDVGFWETDVADPDAPPAELRPFAEVAASAAFRDVLTRASAGA